MEEPTIFRRYDDGYVVRRMTKEDAKIVQGWYCTLGYISRHDLDICLEVYPPGHGFYVGELDNKVIASAVRIPWSPNVFYGSYYFVDVDHRGKGYGTRLRDEVAREYVGESILCVDAVLGKVAENNRTKYGYSEGFTSGRWEGPAISDVEASCAGTIHKAEDVPFDDIMAYDDKNFVSAGNQIRRDFMQRWLRITGGASYIVKDTQGHIVGLGCRHPCIAPSAHIVGPLYADTLEVAEVLMKELCKGIAGDTVILNFWYKNPDILKLVTKFQLHKTFDLKRMHVNGDPNEYKPSVYGLTSIDTCGF